MNRDAPMFSTLIAQFTGGGGAWMFLGAVVTTAGLAVVGILNIRSKDRASRNNDLAARERNLVQHLVDEVSRLSSLVADLDISFKARSVEHQAQLAQERDECNAKIAGLKLEIEMLKERMTHEEHR